MIGYCRNLPKKNNSFSPPTSILMGPSHAPPQWQRRLHGEHPKDGPHQHSSACSAWQKSSLPLPGDHPSQRKLLPFHSRPSKRRVARSSEAADGSTFAFLHGLGASLTHLDSLPLPTRRLGTLAGTSPDSPPG